MEKINKFINSIYIGDRFCEQIEIQKDKIYFQINCISRLEKGSTEWNYYDDEDIEHGCIVFDEVVYCDMNSKLPINDEIYQIEVAEKNDDVYSFVVYGCHISDDAVSTEIQMLIKAKDIYLLDKLNNIIFKE